MAGAAPSKTSIANAALRLLGERRINSIDDQNSKGARVVNDAYDDVRRDMLRTQQPRFATTRVELSANATAPAFGFANAFDLPSDYLRMLDSRNASDSRWVVEGNQILTDLGAPLGIIYIRDIEDVQKFDASFRQAFAAALALEVADSLTGTLTESEKAAQTARFRAMVAGGADGQEATADRVEGSQWLLSRVSSSGGRLNRIGSGDSGLLDLP